MLYEHEMLPLASGATSEAPLHHPSLPMPCVPPQVQPWLLWRPTPALVAWEAVLRPVSSRLFWSFIAASWCSTLYSPQSSPPGLGQRDPSHLQAGEEPAATTLQRLQQHNLDLLTEHLRTKRQMVRLGADWRLTPVLEECHVQRTRTQSG